MIFEELEAFQRDLKALQKRYRSLAEDLVVVKQILAVFPDARPPFSYQLSGVGDGRCVVKVKKIACKAMKGKGVQTGLRLVYAYFPDSERIVFLEIYHKSDQEIETKHRIMEFLDAEESTSIP